MGKPIKPQLPFFSSALNHSIIPEERLRKLMPWVDKGMEVGFVNELVCNLRKHVVHSLGKPHSCF